jgi:hypothetical protein
MDSFLGWFWLVLSVLIPVILALVLTCCESKIKKKGSLYERIEDVFSEVKLDNWYSINFVTIFFLRRMSLVITIFFCVGDWAVFQAIYNLNFSFFYILYLVNFRPFKDNFQHKKELFTEFCFLMFGYGLLHFNPILDPEMLWKVGWYCIGVISLNLSLNALVVIVDILIRGKNNCKKMCSWCKVKCCSDK